jgi:hypothetical protein
MTAVTFSLGVTESESFLSLSSLGLRRSGGFSLGLAMPNAAALGLALGLPRTESIVAARSLETPAASFESDRSRNLVLGIVPICSLEFDLSLSVGSFSLESERSLVLVPEESFVAITCSLELDRSRSGIGGL